MKVHYFPSFVNAGEVNLDKCPPADEVMGSSQLTENGRQNQSEDLAELEMREQTKSPTESVNSFDMLSEGGDKKEDDDDDGGVADEQEMGEEEESTDEQEKQSEKAKKCFAVLKVRPMASLLSSTHCPNLKFEFFASEIGTAGSSCSAAVKPTIFRMAKDILPKVFGMPMDQLLTHKFVLKLQIREQVDDSGAVFVDIEQDKWDSELVEHRAIYKALLFPKLKQDEEKGDAKSSNRRGGQILFRMTNFNAFSKGCGPKIVFSEPPVIINGMPWRLRVKHCDESIRSDLFCGADANDLAWSCRAAFTVGALSCIKSDEWAKKKGNLDDFRLFDSTGPLWGCEMFNNIQKLMDPKNGIYDEKGDAVTFKAEICAEEPKGMPGVLNGDSLVVNGKVILVNKYILAANSKFFQNLFFGKNAEKMPKIHLEGNGNAVENFERLIATIYPTNLQLDDGCVENVLLLAHRFLLESVKNRCVKFLVTKSKKSAICKFRLAHHCDVISMKKKVLTEMSKNDFAVSGENFVGNLLDNKHLDVEAVNELMARHAQLFGTK